MIDFEGNTFPQTSASSLSPSAALRLKQENSEPIVPK
jgi:hypothetical protein